MKALGTLGLLLLLAISTAACATQGNGAQASPPTHTDVQAQPGYFDRGYETQAP